MIFKDAAFPSPVSSLDAEALSPTVWCADELRSPFFCPCPTDLPTFQTLAWWIEKNEATQWGETNLAAYFHNQTDYAGHFLGGLMVSISMRMPLRLVRAVRSTSVFSIQYSYWTFFNALRFVVSFFEYDANSALQKMQSLHAEEHLQSMNCYWRVAMPSKAK